MAYGWERIDYPDGRTTWERECAECDQGVLSNPTRYCEACKGSGFIVVWQKNCTTKHI